MAGATAVGNVGVAVPLPDRALIGREHFGQLQIPVSVFFLLKLNVNAMRIANTPFDQVQRNSLQCSLRFLADRWRHAPAASGDGDVIPKRIDVRAHLAPRKSQPVQIDFPKPRTFLVFQQRLVRQVSQFVVGKIDFAAAGPATVMRHVIGVAAPGPILIRLRIFFVAGDVLGGFQEREQLQRPQRRFVFSFRCLEEPFRIFTPARRLARDVN